MEPLFDYVTGTLEHVSIPAHIGTAQTVSFYELRGTTAASKNA